MTVGADAGHRAQVDELDLVLGDDDVVRLQVVVNHPAGVKVVQRLQDLQDVTDGDVHVEHPTGQAPAARPQRRAAHELHDNEPAGAARIIDEVEDLHDARVGDIRKKRPLGLRHRGLVRILRGHHSLEHHVAIGHLVIDRDIDPAQATVGDGAQDLVLAGDDVAPLQRRRLHPAGDLLAGIHHGRFRLRGRDERQAHHAASHRRSLAMCAAALAERAESLAPGALVGILRAVRRGNGVGVDIRGVFSVRSRARVRITVRIRERVKRDRRRSGLPIGIGKRVEGHRLGDFGGLTVVVTLVVPEVIPITHGNSPALASAPAPPIALGCGTSSATTVPVRGTRPSTCRTASSTSHRCGCAPTCY